MTNQGEAVDRNPRLRRRGAMRGLFRALAAIWAAGVAWRAWAA